MGRHEEDIIARQAAMLDALHGRRCKTRHHAGATMDEGAEKGEQN